MRLGCVQSFGKFVLPSSSTASSLYSRKSVLELACIHYLHYFRSGDIIKIIFAVVMFNHVLILMMVFILPTYNCQIDCGIAISIIKMFKTVFKEH